MEERNAGTLPTGVVLNNLVKVFLIAMASFILADEIVINEYSQSRNRRKTWQTTLLYQIHFA